MDNTELLRQLEPLPLKEIAFIDPQIIHFSDEVRRICESNTCGQFGTTWQCPPAVGPLAELKALCLRYNEALLFSTVAPLEDSFDFEGMISAMEAHQALSLDIRETVRRMIAPRACLLFGAGACKLCESCTYPNGEPCRMPEKATASMESIGINVVELCRSTGFKYNNGPDTVTYFSLIFM